MHSEGLGPIHRGNRQGAVGLGGLHSKRTMSGRISAPH